MKDKNKMSLKEKIEYTMKAKRVYSKAMQSFKKLCKNCQNKVRVNINQRNKFKNPDFYCDKCKKIIKKYWSVKDK